jgi:hypothetical protein
MGETPMLLSSLPGDRLVHVEDHARHSGVRGQLSGVDVDVAGRFADAEEFCRGVGVGEVRAEVMVEAVDEDLQLGLTWFARDR